ncbi:MAG: methylmalonyl Co-A mutase-associated GTPase MeaB [Thermaerobacter sp.]|nr:methylmalonyl Co-A mutase-associated GTPase MeaB [Thermaerobacter sp.]
MSLGKDILQGDRRALARALTLVENQMPEADEIVREVFGHTGRAIVVGITGAPGVGKSTLVDRLTGHFLSLGRQVGVLAVDPSSPFSGGALLGDRVRMEGRGSVVFMRSLAARGHLGGLARATPRAIQLLEAAGKDLILLETVGAGQSEVDVMGYADTTVVVVVPGLGDDVQAFKAGILEIGDVFVVNKADRPGADQTMRELRQMLSLGPRKAWQPPVLAAKAQSGEGIEEIAAAVLQHKDSAERNPEVGTRHVREAERFLRQALADQLVAHAVARAKAAGRWESLVEDVARRRKDPVWAAKELEGGEERE